MAGRLARNLHEVGATALDMLLMRYPRFVYGGASVGDVPVFCFHGVEPDSFEAILSFLTSNSYTTLDCDEYRRILSGQTFAPARSVLLTFDDGWGSLWTVGLPLIWKYSARITVFLAAGRIEHCGERLPNLDDLSAGRCSEADVLHRDASEHPLLTWREVAEMHATGLVDFQSHSLNHGLVCSSLRIVDFVHPSLLKTCNLMELPCCCDGLQSAGPRPPVRLGEPMYASTPRLSDVPALKTDRRVADTCANYVESHGGAGFFEQPDWRRVLERLSYEQVRHMRHEQESPEDQMHAVRFELEESKRIIEEALPGKSVRHICYPWHVAGEIARSQAADVGYESAFMGKMDGMYYNPIPCDPSMIARLGGDFLFRLPGKGRVSLWSILMQKAARRRRHGPAYITH